jgi:hypothetical protein
MGNDDRASNCRCQDEGKPIYAEGSVSGFENAGARDSSSLPRIQKHWLGSVPKGVLRDSQTRKTLGSAVSGHTCMWRITYVLIETVIDMYG